MFQTGDETNYKTGFIDKTGSWVIKPQLKKAYSFVNGRSRVCFGQTGFTKEDWQNRSDKGYVNRGIAFDLFVKQYGLIGMDRKKVNALLGKPDRHHADSDVYSLLTTFCGNAYVGVEIHYEKEKATKYHGLYAFEQGKWIQNVSQTTQ